MAKKKGGFGRFLGAITGTPYERLLKQVDKVAEQFEDEEEELASQLEALVDQAGDAYEEETIDEEEHDLIIEAKIFGHLLRDPWHHRLHLNLAHIHFLSKYFGELGALQQLLLLVTKTAQVLPGRDTSEGARHVGRHARKARQKGGQLSAQRA